MDRGFKVPHKRTANVWTPEKIAQLQSLVDAGFTREEIAREVGMGLKSLVRKLSELGIRSKGSKTAKFMSNFEARSSRAAQHAAKVASIMHLVDLKRAGHSSTFTEYRIEPDGLGVRYFPEACGAYRSPAALMAEG